MPALNNMGTYNPGVGSYLIKKDDGVRIMALKLAAGGAATITGSAKIGAFGNSVPIALVAGEPTIVSNQDNMDGLTLDITVGTVLIITNQ
jgi:hypothetical protein